jgi:soluble lytic murein transglycosylase-like protein
LRLAVAALAWLVAAVFVAGREAEAAVRHVASRYWSVVSRYAHTVCWYNRRYTQGQCAWVADRILRYSARHGIDPRFVMAVVASESGFNHSAVSVKGALGFGQLMPYTAKSLGVDPTDPDENLEGSVRKLAMLSREFRRADLVAAAYNAGAGAVRAYGGVPPYRETQGFVRRVVTLYVHFLSHPAWSPEW